MAGVLMGGVSALAAKEEAPQATIEEEAEAGVEEWAEVREWAGAWEEAREWEPTDPFLVNPTR